jgi:hypothetical protein
MMFELKRLVKRLLGVSLILLCAATLRAQEISVINADFEKVQENGQLTGWQTYGWGKADTHNIACGQRKDAGPDGSACAWLGATTDHGAQGLVSSQIKDLRRDRVLQVTVMLKGADGYAGHRPWPFLAWSDTTGKFMSTTNLTGVPKTDGDWQMWGIALSPDKLPENAGSFTLNVATSSQKGAVPKGVLLIDQVRVQWVEKSTLPVASAVKPAPDPWTHANWIKPKAYAAWFTWGKPVVYEVDQSKLPVTLSELKGVISDSSGRVIDTVKVSREQLLAQGWVWRPMIPGHFTVQFEGLSKGQSKWKPLSRTYGMRAPTGQTQHFTIDTWELAVPADANLPATQRSRQYGVSLGYDDGRGALLSDLMGMQFVRFHAIGWGANFTNESMGLEIKPGQYNWGIFDKQMNNFRKLGFEVVGNVMYTPRWASPHPEDDSVHICVRGFSAYAPKDLSTWTGFLSQLINRYGSDIKTWELWNEPNIPGGSVFWKDTPENFTAMMQAGYKTIKALQPESEVWLGGMGPRSSYFTFYDQFLGNDGGPYYDKLALHGSYPTPQPFYNMDRKHGSKPKSWVNSEWHAVLYQTTSGEDAAVLPSEQQVSMRMMTDLMQQIRGGVERIALFIPVGIVDREVMPFARENRWVVHWSGMFRSRPVQEPRLCAMVLQHLFSDVSSPLVYRDAYTLGKQHVACFEHDGKQRCMLWLDGEDGQLTDVALNPLLFSASRITTWYGAPVKLDQGRIMLEPNTMYLLRSVSEKSLAVLPSDDQLISNPRMKKFARVEKVQGQFKAGSLFTSVDAVKPETLPWQDQDMQYITMDGRPQTPSFKARFAVGLTADHMDLVVQVTDARHVVYTKDHAYWQGDSIQFAVDPDGTAQPGNSLECVMALDNGKPMLMKTMVPYIGGDLPEGFTPKGQPVVNAQTTIRQIDANTWQYVVRLARSEMYPFSLHADKPLRFSLLINNSDGKGRAGYLQWASGIGDDKNPAVYGTLQPVVPK